MFNISSISETDANLLYLLIYLDNASVWLSPVCVWNSWYVHFSYSIVSFVYLERRDILHVNSAVFHRICSLDNVGVLSQSSLLERSDSQSGVTNPFSILDVCRIENIIVGRIHNCKYKMYSKRIFFLCEYYICECVFHWIHNFNLYHWSITVSGITKKGQNTVSLYHWEKN